MKISVLLPTTPSQPPSDRNRPSRAFTPLFPHPIIQLFSEAFRKITTNSTDPRAPQTTEDEIESNLRRPTADDHFLSCLFVCFDNFPAPQIISIHCASIQTHILLCKGGIKTATVNFLYDSYSAFNIYEYIVYHDNLCFCKC